MQSDMDQSDLPHLADSECFIEYLDVMSHLNRTVEVATFSWDIDDPLQGRTELSLPEDYLKYTGEVMHDGEVQTKPYWYVWDARLSQWRDHSFFEKGTKIVLLRRDAVVALRRREYEQQLVACGDCGAKIHRDKLAASGGVHLGCEKADSDGQPEQASTEESYRD
jgi:hypothetical protein